LREYERRYLWVKFTHALEEIQAAHSRKFEVHQKNVHSTLFQNFEGEFG
jgi:hypothetical protein